MTITLDHTIVPSNDHDEAARFLARIFGLEYDGAGHFAPVRVNEHLTLDFANRSDFDEHHYAFLVGDGEFDEIFQRLVAEGIVYGSGPPLGRGRRDQPSSRWARALLPWRSRSPPVGDHDPSRNRQLSGRPSRPDEVAVAVGSSKGSPLEQAEGSCVVSHHRGVDQL